ncbi:hypothetical protein [Globicatella sulfidifaciens]|uniref:Uncharacterized protein n=1 Tax=Globicatella sulfidifaciens TaxID=136093 RepID=A0A7X8C5J0_9LACT|nr:hypothetical protein [Globicatella sulfidifaciens]NLJ19326.1 hypothetical protein [Globicatella sulfidifaciens]
MNGNKYSRLFNENMSSMEARTILYATIDSCPADEREMLNQAYIPVARKIARKELIYANKKDFMMP